MIQWQADIFTKYTFEFRNVLPSGYRDGMVKRKISVFFASFLTLYPYILNDVGFRSCNSMKNKNIEFIINN